MAGEAVATARETDFWSSGHWDSLRRLLPPS